MYIAKTLMFVLMTAFVLTATDAAAKDTVYRWVDDKGVVHFGDQPAATGDVEVVEGLPRETASSEANAAAEDSAIFPVQEEKSRLQQQRETRMERNLEAREKADAIAAGCAQRRKIVSQLEPPTRVMVRGESGEVYRLDDNERLKALDEAKAYIAKNCNNQILNPANITRQL